MRTLAATVTAGALALLTACSATPTPADGPTRTAGQPSGTSRPSAISPPSTAVALGTGRNAKPTPAGNRRLTKAETRRVVRLLHLPHGSRRLAHEPRRLARLGSSPSGRAVVNSHRFWSVPLRLAAVQHWVLQHRPHGFTDGGYGSGPHDREVYLQSSRTNPAWTQETLQVTATPNRSDGTFWRIDAIALWINPRPERVAAGGHRITVRPADGCPASDRGATDVPDEGDSARLLPPGRPTGALVCSYHGYNGKAFRLARHRHLGAGAALRLAHLARRAGLGWVSVMHSCPLGLGTVVVVAFTYRNGRVASLWDQPTGCSSIDNGTIYAGIGGTSDRLATALRRFAVYR